MGIFSKKDTTDSKDEKPKAEKKAEIKVAEKEAVKKSTKDLYSNTAKPNTKSDQVKSKFSDAYKVIVKPLITEKATHDGALNKYYFEVAANTNKIEVAKSIEQIYGIKPTGVNIINMLGKKTRAGRTTGKRKDWKKAIITLPQGKSINVYEGV